MNETSSTEQTQAGDSGRGVSRSKSLGEVRESVSDHIDEMDGNALLSRVLTYRYRRRHLPQAEGRVLDVACGTATNRQFLPDSTEYVGVDISPEMLDRADERFPELTQGEQLREMDAQDLDFAEDSFDTVISSMSTCMFPDPIAALNEMKRVCKPEGDILLLEHGRSSVGPLARFQDWRADSHYEEKGCRWNQEPLAVVAESELTVRESSAGMLGIITTIVAD